MCVRQRRIPVNITRSYLWAFNVNISIDEYVKQPFSILINHDFETRQYNRTGLLVYSHFVN